MFLRDRWIDERPPPVLEAYPASRALQIPNGDHRVVLKFRPGSFKIGAMVTLSTLFVLGFYLVLSLFGSRTKRERKSELGPDAGKAQNHSNGSPARIAFGGEEISQT